MRIEIGDIIYYKPLQVAPGRLKAQYFCNLYLSNLDTYLIRK